MCSERSDRIFAAPPYKVLREPPLVLGNRRIAHELFRVDDREVEPGLHAMVEHHRVQHFAPGLGQAEGHVRDAENSFTSGQRGLDDADALDRLDRGTDIVAIAGADREYERIEDYVLRLDAVFLCQQLARALRDLEFAFVRDRLRLLLVLVDTSDDERRAVAPREWYDQLKALLSIFEVDRVDNRFAGRALERLLDHARIGRIDHQRHFDLAHEVFEEGRHVGSFVAVGILKAYVKHVRAAPHLVPSDFRGLFDLALGDEPFELAAAEHVGALANHDRARALVDYQRFNSGDDRAAQRGNFAPPLALEHLRQDANVLGRRPAASANHVDPAGVDEALELAREHLGRFIVTSFFVGKSGVRHACDRKTRDSGQRAQMVGHEVGTGCAIEAHPQKVAMRDRGIERLDILAREQRAHRFDRARNGDRGRDPGFFDRAFDSNQPGLAVERVLHRFEQQDIDAALD